MLDTLRIRGVFTSYTGYGRLAEQVGRAVESLGTRVTVEDYGADTRYGERSPWVDAHHTSAPPDGLVLHVTPPDWPFDRSAPTAWLTMWESTGLPEIAPQLLNGARAVLVPCRWCADNFARGGVTAPIQSVPFGVDEGEGYGPRPMPVHGPTRFGMIARLCHGGCRKGWHEGIAAFSAAFPAGDEPVELWLKCWPDDLAYLPELDDPRIRITTANLAPPRLAAWYHNLTALLVPSKAEGWGLPALAAMACGRPVIAAKYSGTAEYFDARHGWELEYDHRPAADVYAGCGSWAEPRHESIVAALRAVHADRGEACRRGEAAAARAAEFTWRRTAERITEVLESAA